MHDLWPTAHGVGGVKSRAAGDELLLSPQLNLITEQGHLYIEHPWGH